MPRTVPPLMSGLVSHDALYRAKTQLFSHVQIPLNGERDSQQLRESENSKMRENVLMKTIWLMLVGMVYGDMQHVKGIMINN